MRGKHNDCMTTTRVTPRKWRARPKGKRKKKKKTILWQCSIMSVSSLPSSAGEFGGKLLENLVRSEYYSLNVFVSSRWWMCYKILRKQCAFSSLTVCQFHPRYFLFSFLLAPPSNIYLSQKIQFRLLFSSLFSALAVSVHILHEDEP